MGRGIASLTGEKRTKVIVLRLSETELRRLRMRIPRQNQKEADAVSVRGLLARVLSLNSDMESTTSQATSNPALVTWCRVTTGHQQVPATSFCVCGHAMYT